MPDHYDTDGDGVADRQPPPDAQSRAFSEVVPSENESLLAASTFHSPDDPVDIRTPEEWDAEGWDEDREGPKSLEEAKDTLASRIDDPRAPDGPEVQGAYDDLEVDA